MNHFVEQYVDALKPYVFLLARVVIGYMFLLHGTAKFFEFPMSMTDGHGAVSVFSLMGVGGLLEIGGGVLMMLGLWTRWVAFVLAGQMAVAYFMFHVSGGNVFNPLGNHGEAAVLYSMAYLMLMMTGAGRLSLDAKWGLSQSVDD